jgi:hypothetical protein
MENVAMADIQTSLNTLCYWINNSETAWSFLTLQCGGFKNPVHTVMWEGFSMGYSNFELNCAGVYSK